MFILTNECIAKVMKGNYKGRDGWRVPAVCGLLHPPATQAVLTKTVENFTFRWTITVFEIILFDYTVHVLHSSGCKKSISAGYELNVLQLRSSHFSPDLMIEKSQITKLSDASRKANFFKSANKFQFRLRLGVYCMEVNCGQNTKILYLIQLFVKFQIIFNFLNKIIGTPFVIIVPPLVSYQ